MCLGSMLLGSMLLGSMLLGPMLFDAVLRGAQLKPGGVFHLPMTDSFRARIVAVAQGATVLMETAETARADAVELLAKLDNFAALGLALTSEQLDCMESKLYPFVVFGGVPVDVVSDSIVDGVRVYGPLPE